MGGSRLFLHASAICSAWTAILHPPCAQTKHSRTLGSMGLELHRPESAKKSHISSGAGTDVRVKHWAARGASLGDSGEPLLMGRAHHPAVV